MQHRTVLKPISITSFLISPQGAVEISFRDLTSHLFSQKYLSTRFICVCGTKTLPNTGSSYFSICHSWQISEKYTHPNYQNKWGRNLILCKKSEWPHLMCIHPTALILFTPEMIELKRQIMFILFAFLSPSLPLSDFHFCISHFGFV